MCIRPKGFVDRGYAARGSRVEGREARVKSERRELRARGES